MEIPALADLLDLQEVDLQIDRLLERRQSLPELTAYREANQRRQAAESARDEVAGRHKQVSLELDKAEGELDILESKLNESETRLYAGGMSSRETEHKRLEVTSLRGQQSAMEERVLALLDRRELLETELATAEQAVETALAEEKELESTIAQLWKEIDLELGRRESRKAEIVPSIPGDLLDLYDTLRKTKEGVAVGRFDHGACGGCHLALSAPEQSEAKEYDPPRCTHCRRILVF
ncbi:MAG: zinc ribbon domain-containing protein [Acidimicrobiia bacterium]